MSIRGNSANVYAGLCGFWQGSLSAGTYQITVQHRGGATGTHYTNNDYLTRAMNIIYCDWHVEIIWDACTQHTMHVIVLYSNFNGYS